MSYFDKLFFGAKKKESESLQNALHTMQTSFLGKLGKLMLGKSTINDGILDELEDVLISSDVGVETTVKIICRIKSRVQKDKYINSSHLNQLLREEICELLTENHPEQRVESKKPYVLMVVGVNGVGKTTTIGKLAGQYKSQGKSVILGAADTFRAAAVEQLKVWGERTKTPVIAKEMNADPSSVAFETMTHGVATNADVIIIDTAGRLHTKVNLMQELTKIKRVIQKVIPDAPHDVMLVLDGSTGQNAMIQAREFIKATEVSCLTVTKLDGTAKGGVVIGISDMFHIPVRYIGTGEGVDDLQVFDKNLFVNTLFSGAPSVFSE